MAGLASSGAPIAASLGLGTLPVTTPGVLATLGSIFSGGAPLSSLLGAGATTAAGSGLAGALSSIATPLAAFALPVAGAFSQLGATRAKNLKEGLRHVGYARKSVTEDADAGRGLRPYELENSRIYPVSSDYKGANDPKAWNLDWTLLSDSLTDFPNADIYAMPYAIRIANEILRGQRKRGEGVDSDGNYLTPGGRYEIYSPETMKKGPQPTGNFTAIPVLRVERDVVENLLSTEDIAARHSKWHGRRDPRTEPITLAEVQANQERDEPKFREGNDDVDRPRRPIRDRADSNDD